MDKNTPNATLRDMRPASLLRCAPSANPGDVRSSPIRADLRPTQTNQTPLDATPINANSGYLRPTQIRVICAQRRPAKPRWEKTRQTRLCVICAQRHLCDVRPTRTPALCAQRQPGGLASTATPPNANLGGLRPIRTPVIRAQRHMTECALSASFWHGEQREFWQAALDAT